MTAPRAEGLAPWLSQPHRPRESRAAWAAHRPLCRPGSLAGLQVPAQPHPHARLPRGPAFLRGVGLARGQDFGAWVAGRELPPEPARVWDRKAACPGRGRRPRGEGRQGTAPTLHSLAKAEEHNRPHLLATSPSPPGRCPCAAWRRLRSASSGRFRGLRGSPKAPGLEECPLRSLPAARHGPARPLRPPNTAFGAHPPALLRPQGPVW